MSRRTIEKSDSLEMLLDTMCNTFGGIILISLIISLISGGAPRNSPPTPPVPSAPARPDPRLEAARSHHSNLLSKAEAVWDTLELIRQIDAAQGRIARALDPTGPDQRQKQAEEAEFESLSKTNRTLQTKQGNLSDRISKIIAERAALSNRTANEISPPLYSQDTGGTAKSARERWDFIVVGGQIYPPYFMNQGRPQRNESSIFWTPAAADGSSFRLTPIPGRGADPSGFERLLGTISPREHIVHFLLYDDSFALFRILRDLAVRKGFGYDFDPCVAGLPITTGNSPRSSPNGILNPP